MKVVRGRVEECVGEYPAIYLEIFSQELVPIRIGRANSGFRSGDILTSTALLTTTALNQIAQCFCLDCTLRSYQPKVTGVNSTPTVISNLGSSEEENFILCKWPNYDTAQGADSSERIIAPMRWGLVPSWFKEGDPSKLQFNTSNCRSDTIMEKPSFKVPLGKGRRCVVLADGFYEWQRCHRTSQRQPYFIYFPQIKTEKSGSIGAAHSPEDWEKVWDNWRLLTMAGIFDCWEPPEGGDCLYSYTIITVDSCKGLNDIHHRMPAILDGEEAVSKWLDFGKISTQEALKLIHPTENVIFHPVSHVVNNLRNNTPECLIPMDLLVKKELKASGSSQKMLQWLATKSPKKENPKTSQKTESDVPQWSSQFLQKSPFPTKRGSARLLEQWLKKEKEEEPVNKRPHSQ